MNVVRRLAAAFGVAALLAAAAVRADAPPPLPTAEHLMLWEIILRAGFACRGASVDVRLQGQEAESYAKSGYDAYAVTCYDGEKYLVEIAQRYRDGKPVAPLPPPVVKPAPK